MSIPRLRGKKLLVSLKNMCYARGSFSATEEASCASLFDLILAQVHVINVHVLCMVLTG